MEEKKLKALTFIFSTLSSKDLKLGEFLRRYIKKKSITKKLGFK